MTIIDSSVYIASISPHEKFYAHSLLWLQQAAATKAPLLAPAIFLAEVAAALSRGQKNTNLAQRAVSILRNSKVIDLQPVSITLAESAARIAGEQKIRGCDAVYVALALHLNQPLVTLDKQLADRGSNMIRMIRLWEAP